MRAAFPSARHANLQQGQGALQTQVRVRNYQIRLRVLLEAAQRAVVPFLYARRRPRGDLLNHFLVCPKLGDLEHQRVLVIWVVGRLQVKRVPPRPAHERDVGGGAEALPLVVKTVVLALSRDRLLGVHEELRALGPHVIRVARGLAQLEGAHEDTNVPSYPHPSRPRHGHLIKLRVRQLEVHPDELLVARVTLLEHHRRRLDGLADFEERVAHLRAALRASEAVIHSHIQPGSLIAGQMALPSTYGALHFSVPSLPAAHDTITGGLRLVEVVRSPKRCRLRRLRIAVAWTKLHQWSRLRVRRSRVSISVRRVPPRRPTLVVDHAQMLPVMLRAISFSCYKRFGTGRVAHTSRSHHRTVPSPPTLDCGHHSRLPGPAPRAHLCCQSSAPCSAVNDISAQSHRRSELLGRLRAGRLRPFQPPDSPISAPEPDMAMCVRFMAATTAESKEKPCQSPRYRCAAGGPRPVFHPQAPDSLAYLCRGYGSALASILRQSRRKWRRKRPTSACGGETSVQQGFVAGIASGSPRSPRSPRRPPEAEASAAPSQCCGGRTRALAAVRASKSRNFRGFQKARKRFKL
eukprot:scaffold1247_cov251-Pinguiococcus_pyrenoidosus.AAC.8